MTTFRNRFEPNSSPSASRASNRPSLQKTYTSPADRSNVTSSYDDPAPADGRVEDPQRVDYLVTHLAAVAEAIGNGVDVRGYFAWSLLDNFEWAWGYDKRFGIVHVDYDTQVRTVKDSGRTYAAVISDSKLAP